MKFTASVNVRDKCHKITKEHKHSSVTLSIRMLRHLKVYLNVEHLFMHY